MPKPNTSEAATKARPRASHNGHAAAVHDGHDAFVMPIVHVSVPESAVTLGFWTVLVGSVALGAVDLPLAALIGTGVLIARHHRSE
jgi:hypothetical protein